ncbi:MAG: hypothetical protein IKP10_04115 [Clostridia bacterium]|nr:hypothetical protein [Clostridia bacterium]
MANELQRGQERDGLEIDLIELLYRFLENARYLILAAVAGALAMALYTFLFVTPTYKATSKLYISNSKDSVINLSDLQMGTNLALDYIEIFDAHDVPELVLRRLQDEYPGKYDKYTSYSQIAGKIGISNKTGTRLIAITATSTDKVEAAEIANMYLDVALHGTKDGDYGKITEKIGTTGLEFERAVTPQRPSAPNRVRNIVLGLLVGLLLAAVVITIQYIVDDRVRNTEQLEKRLGLPVLGMMPETEGNESSSGSHHNASSGRRPGRKGGKA